MRLRSPTGPSFLIAALGVGLVVGAEPGGPVLELRFHEIVRPFLKSQCLECHGAHKPKGKLDLSGYTSLEAVVKDYRVWNRVADRLEADEMPPDDAPRRPTSHERRAVTDWIAAVLEDQARKNAGDPGRVLARRLSNAEFDYTFATSPASISVPLANFPWIRPTRPGSTTPANR